jgi:uncharacterized damage-inducible protein DinB
MTRADLRSFLEFVRKKTLDTLDAIAKRPDAAELLAWRPGPGRAHVAWQLMHIGITEELFATERLAPPKKPAWSDLVPRFKGGSTPDENIPTLDEIRRILDQSRQHLLETLATFKDIDLGHIPEALKERKLTLLDCLHILPWHEAHHQGQCHITLNLYKAAHG